MDKRSNFEIVNRNDIMCVILLPETRKSIVTLKQLKATQSFQFRQKFLLETVAHLFKISKFSVEVF